MSDASARPQWAVLIPTLNSANHLESCLESVLSQDPGADTMEIIVVDDHSTVGDPEAIVRSAGRGRVRFVRQESNVGKVRNFETGLLLSRGDLIHQLHGDDRVGPGFYDAMSRAFNAHPSAGAFFSESRYISLTGSERGRTGRERAETGILDGWLELIATSQRIQAPSIVVRRTVYEELGGFDRRLDMVEDWEMWIRIASRFPVGFVADTIADYRISPSGTSANEARSGRVAQRIRTLISIVDEYLPPALVDKIKSRRNRETAQYIAQLIPQLVQQRNYRGVFRGYMDAARFSMNPRTLYRLVAYTLQYRRFVNS